MLDNLTNRFYTVFRNIRGQARLDEENIKPALREVRLALLEADVALPVVKDFVADLKAKAVGQEISENLTAEQAFISIVNQALIDLMGKQNSALNLAVSPPAVVLMAGLQGAGKTTSVAKLAKYLTERQKKKVLVVSADVYRPAAIKQLETLANDIGVEFFPSSTSQTPAEIAAAAVDSARKRYFDVLIVDTAGRLHVDSEMMEEIQQLHRQLNPIETLFVVDAMTGQDAANTAKAFSEALPLTGVILTKADGDARGGAALSVRHITGKPIKFIGMGEKTDALEPFHPDRIASRILGMGDVLSLIEEMERNVDKEKATKLAQKVQKGKGFDLEDFREQLVQMRNMGGMMSMLDKLPGVAGLPENVKGQLDDKLTVRMEAIINSMTPAERRNPDIIKGSRKKRIASGSGTEIQDVNRMLKQFDQMQKMMKKMAGKGGLRKMMSGMKNMLPPGGFGRGGF